MRTVAASYRERKPDLHICLDSSAINIPFARQAKSFGIPVLYYIAPQLWASREGRIKQMRQYVDHVACIFPFEQEYFRSRGVKATFVGHPLFDQLPPDRLERASTGPRFPDRPPVIGIAAGSRSSEMAANFPGLLDIALAIRKEYPKAKFLIPTVGDDRFIIYMSGNACFDRSIGVDVWIKRNAFDEFVPQCDLMLTKSGTSTVHVAAYGVPMIVVYRVNSFLWNVFARRLIKTRKIAMVNILGGQTDVVPEFIPFSDPAPAIECALDLLRHPEKLAEQKQRLARVMKQIDRPGASMNAAHIAMKLIEGQDL
jgi:lipid-A-disaccharide synthase